VEERNQIDELQLEWGRKTDEKERVERITGGARRAHMLGASPILVDERESAQIKLKRHSYIGETLIMFLLGFVIGYVVAVQSNIFRKENFAWLENMVGYISGTISSEANSDD